MSRRHRTSGCRRCPRLQLDDIHGVFIGEHLKYPSRTEVSLMDVASLKAKALEETTRFFLEKQGYAPDPDSDEWEDEYRRQFALAQAQPETAQHSADPSSEAAGAPGPDSEP